MSVKERAKAYEDSVARNSLPGESPPLRKKSREELTGNITDNDFERDLLEEKPTPPPRKCKKKGENSPNNSSPVTERKENIPVQQTLRQLENAKGRSPVKPTIIIAQKKKRGPPPAPPPRGSSLGRNAEHEQIPPKKKERPPVPPKPKNYVPKVPPPQSKKVSGPNGTAGDIKTEPITSNSSPSRPSSKFFVELDKQNNQSISLNSSKLQGTESESRFVAWKDVKQSGSPSEVESTETRKEDSNGELSAKTLEQGKNLAVKNSIKDGFAKHENKSACLEKSSFTSYVNLTEQGCSAVQQTLDPLEGLEVNDILLQYEGKDSEGESINFNEITDPERNGIMQANQGNLVLTCDDSGESSTRNDLKLNCDIVVAHVEERPAISEQALLEEDKYTLTSFCDALSDEQSTSTFCIVSEEEKAEQCNEGSVNYTDNADKIDKVQVRNRSNGIRSAISSDLDVENIGETAEKEIGKMADPPADKPVQMISNSCSEDIVDEQTRENAIQISQHSHLPERTFVSGFDNHDEVNPEETLHAEGMDIGKHLLSDEIVLTDADNADFSQENTGGESDEEVVVGNKVTSVEEPFFVSYDNRNTGKEKDLRISEAEDYQVNLFENKEAVLEDKESTEDTTHALTAEERTEDPAHALTAEERIEDPVCALTAEERTENPAHALTAEERTEDPTRALTAEERMEDPAHALTVEERAEDPAHALTAEERTEDPAHALTVEERMEDPAHANTMETEYTAINISVIMQRGIGNQGQTQDKVNLIVAESVNDSVVVSVDDDAVKDSWTTELTTGEEEKQQVNFPGSESQISGSRSRMEQLKINSNENTDLEISVIETLDDDDNKVIVKTQDQESDIGFVEVGDEEIVIEQNKLREVTEMENLIEVEYTNHVPEDVVEEQGVVNNMGTVETRQDESINNENVASHQQINQEEVFSEVNNLNGFNDTAVICPGEMNTTEGKDVVVAHLSESVLQGDEKPDLSAGEGEAEPGSPLSPQPIRPKGQQDMDVEKHIQVVVSDKIPSPSSYESVSLYPVPCPMPPPSGNDAIYKVPLSVVPVDGDSVNEYEYSVPSRTFSKDSQYAVPKPIFVQANEVTENVERDLEVYAVPGSATQVPVIETSVDQPVHEESDYPVPRENDNVYMVPAHQSSIVTAVAVSAVPPSKPPRTSPSEKIQSTELAKAAIQPCVVGEKSAEFPRPRPRSRITNGTGTPEVVPRKSSPSPGPRKSSKASQNDSENSEKVVTKESGSPVPLPRSRLNALENYTRESAQSNEETEAMLESKETEASFTKRRTPPPRPPPPVSRVSLVSISGGDMPPMSPGFMDNLDSDSDSDVGEEAACKGASKPKTYYIAHEILSTEQTFVDALKLVFEECYGTIKAASVIAESVLSDIFRDLENIYLLDSRFLQELEERMKTWEEHERIGDIIKKYGHFLKMYTTFVNGYDKAMSVFQETMKENVEFTNLVSEFQASERCHGMQLSAYMLKPVQRIPSYRLLLIDYLKHLPKDSDESKDTEAALKIVSEVATHINESMKKMDSFEQLLKLQTMLVGHPEIVKAGRDYLKEGTLMKLCRKDMQERRFFLLTDVLLYTTPVGVNQYKLNKMLPLLGMQVTVPDSPDFVNEFSIISTTRSFTLTASTPEERDEWVEDLNKAIDVVTKRKITFASKGNASGLPEQNEDVKLGEKAPVWIPDARVTMCMSCTSPFTLTNRRHHCRACGKVVCGACSDCTAPLAYLDFEQTRVCDKCYDLLLKEFHTDEIHIDIEANPLPPLLQESENAEKLLRKPTKFEMMRRFKSRKTKKRKSHIAHPSHLTEVVGNEEGSQMSGYLRCKKGRSGWKKSWFVLKDRVLYAYKASSDVVALESTPVLGYHVEDLGRDEDDFLFNLKHQGITPLAFKADNETSATRWKQELKKAVKLLPS